MNVDEFRQVLAEMDPAAKDELKRKAGFSGDDQMAINAFLRQPPWEKSFCDALGVQPESAKVAHATYEAAHYAKLAFWVAVASVILSVVTLLR